MGVGQWVFGARARDAIHPGPGVTDLRMMISWERQAGAKLALLGRRQLAYSDHLGLLPLEPILCPAPTSLL